MIAFLCGTPVNVKEGRMTLQVGGVGLEVLTPHLRGRRVKRGAPLTLHTSLQVRENSLTLYGFLSEAEKEMFEILLTVQGVGPKVALSVLSTYDPGEVARIVAEREAKALMEVPGVGKKVAQRLLLDLSEALKARGRKGSRSPGEEAREVLVALGASPGEAREVLERIGQDGKKYSVDGLVERSLALLGRKA